jgi:CRP-like cAMP-binding protein
MLAVMAFLTKEAELLREALTAVGSQRGTHSMATFLYQTRERLRLIGHVDEEENRFRFPMTQEEVGHSLGLTNVHVSRVLRDLREDGVLSVKRGECQILDEDKFREMAFVVLR